MRFDPEKVYTVGELYGPAMKITDEEEARNYMTELIVYVLEKWKQEGRFTYAEDGHIDEAGRMVAGNLGYYAGYYGMETNVRVQRLFGCEHPIFGSAENMAKLTPEQILDMGRQRALGLLTERE